MTTSKLARAILGIVALGGLVAPPVQGETLREALAAAYTSNPDLLAARAQKRQVDENVAAAVSNWRPTVTGNVQVERTETNSVASLETGRVISDTTAQGRAETYSAQATQPLFRGMRNFNEYERAKDEVKAQRADLRSVEQQVLLDAVTAYMDVIRDEAVLRLNENNVKVLNRQLEATQDRFRVGEVTRTDVAQAEAALSGAVADRADADAGLQTSRASYRQVIGKAPGSLEEEPPLPPLPETQEAALEIALEENPQVQSARHSEEAARHDVAESKGQLLPTLEANASFSRNSTPIGSQFDPITGNFLSASAVSESTSVGVTLSVPLYQSGAVYSDIRRAKQVRSQRMLEIRAAERQVARDVRVAWENYRASQATIESRRDQVRANEIALEGVRQEAAVGSRTVLDVLEAEQTLLDSRVNLVSAQRDEYVAGFQLLQAIGRLNAASLDLPVELYNPEKYYDQVKWKFVGWGTETSN